MVDIKTTAKIHSVWPTRPANAVVKNKDSNSNNLKDNKDTKQENNNENANDDETDFGIDEFV